MRQTVEVTQCPISKDFVLLSFHRLFQISSQFIRAFKKHLIPGKFRYYFLIYSSLFSTVLYFSQWEETLCCITLKILDNSIQIIEVYYPNSDAKFSFLAFEMSYWSLTGLYQTFFHFWNFKSKYSSPFPTPRSKFAAGIEGGIEILHLTHTIWQHDKGCCKIWTKRGKWVYCNTLDIFGPLPVRIPTSVEK